MRTSLAFLDEMMGDDVAMCKLCCALHFALAVQGFNLQLVEVADAALSMMTNVIS